MADETVKLYNPNDGTKGRAPGVYLDEVERRHLEDYRAVMEQREPNYEELPIGYLPVVREGNRVDNSVYSNPSNAYVTHPVDPVAEVTRSVFDAPAVPKAGDPNYVDNLLGNVTARIQSTPAGARPGQFDGGGFGGPVDDMEGGPGDNTVEGQPVVTEGEKVPVTIKAGVVGTGGGNVTVSEGPRGGTTAAPQPAPAGASGDSASSKSDTPEK